MFYLMPFDTFSKEHLQFCSCNIFMHNFLGHMTISHMKTAISSIEGILGGMFERMKGTEWEVKSMRKNLKNDGPVYLL